MSTTRIPEAVATRAAASMAQARMRPVASSGNNLAQELQRSRGWRQAQRRGEGAPGCGGGAHGAVGGCGGGGARAVLVDDNLGDATAATAAGVKAGLRRPRSPSATADARSPWWPVVGSANKLTGARRKSWW